jgi:hypothetical protein
MTFEVLTMLTMKITIFWDVTPCSLVSEECAASVFRIEEALMVKAVCFSETLVPNCTVSHPTKTEINNAKIFELLLKKFLLKNSFYSLEEFYNLDQGLILFLLFFYYYSFYGLLILF